MIGYGTGSGLPRGVALFSVVLFFSSAELITITMPTPEARLDAFVRRVQAILGRYEGNLIQLAMGDKGSYIYAAFGVPQAHEDDVIRPCPPPRNCALRVAIW